MPRIGVQVNGVGIWNGRMNEGMREKEKSAQYIWHDKSHNRCCYCSQAFILIVNHWAELI
jgi:aerobic-type carbon monoxide dehydrogenase small subunit (CoxS/CutS family)